MTETGVVFRSKGAIGGGLHRNVKNDDGKGQEYDKIIITMTGKKYRMAGWSGCAMYDVIEIFTLKYVRNRVCCCVTVGETGNCPGHPMNIYG